MAFLKLMVDRSGSSKGRHAVALAGSISVDSFADN